MSEAPKPPDNFFSDEHLDKIKRANAGLLLKKLQSGKTLTRQDMRALDDLHKTGKLDPGTAANLSELALALGITRMTLSRWRKRYKKTCPKPNSNQSHNVGEWLQFIRKKNLKQTGKEGAEGDERQSLEMRKLRSQCERTEFLIAIERGDYTKNDEIETEVTRMVRAFWTVVQGIPRKAAVTCAGRSPAEIERVLNDFIDEAKKLLHEGKWPKTR